MSSFWARFSEPLPNVPVKPNNASAIFGGHSPYGLRATEPSIFRPKELPKTRKSGRSNSDAGLTKTTDKQKGKDSSSKRKLSESRLKGNTVQNSANSNRPVSPRSNGKECKEEATDENKSADNFADSPDSGSSNGDRYPLFISTAAEIKPRKQTNELNSDKTTPKSNRPTDGQNQKGQRKIKRSSSFSTTRKANESTPSLSAQSKSPAKTRGVINQQIGSPAKGKSPIDSFRREKSDIIVRPRGSCSPSSNRRENTVSSNSKGAHSPSALKREKSDITFKRSQPGFGILRENSDVVRSRGSASPVALRREKSDIVIHRRSPGIGKRQKSDISLKKKTGTCTPNSSTDTINSCESQSETFNKVKDRKESMSKIPTPTGANPPSKIPSVSKTSSIPQSKIPPKSKIPSIGKADRKEETPKKSQIPTGIPRSDKSASKIPGPPRPDSAKENKDPEINRKPSEDEDTKPIKNEINKVSRIPSAKGASTVSKIPRQDSQGKKSTSAEDDTDNVFADEHENVANSNAAEKVLTQSKIPSLSGSNQASNIPTGLSKIPSFSKTNAPSKPSTTTSPQKTEVVSPVSKIPQGMGMGHSGIPPPTVHAKQEIGQSGIPPPAVHAKPVQSGIPSPAVHAKPATVHSGIPPPAVHAKPETGIRKPETIVSGIPKPEVKASPTSTESKIPQFGYSDNVPKSKIPGLPGSMLTRKLSEERFKKTHEKPTEAPVETTKKETLVKPTEDAVESPRTTEPVSAPASVSIPGGKVAPPPPPRQDVKKEETSKEDAAQSESPMDKFIFSEAKRMEELLRNESIVVEAPSSETAKALKAKDVEAKAEIAKLNFEKGPDVKEMVSGVGQVCHVTGEDNKTEKTSDKESAKKEPVLFSTFGKKEEPVSKEDVLKETPKPSTVTKTEPKKDVGLDLKKEEKEEKKPSVEEKVEESKEKVADVQSPVDENKTAPAIDTLGQYEQQSRRSRSRQRKVISPDSEEPETTFEQAASEDDAKKAVDKDKFGTQPSEGDETKDSQAKAATKPAKGKSKHDKPKFVIESSLGADFYQSKTSQSKESITEETASKPSEVIVIQNKTFDDSKVVKAKDAANNKTAKSDAFEDVDLSSNKGSKMDMKAWSMEQLDEKTVKCACGRGGKCSIM